MQNFIYDSDGNLILDNTEQYIIGDIIVIDNIKEYEVTFIDEQTNLAYAEYNGEYYNNNFVSRYKRNLILFVTTFVIMLLFVFIAILLYKLRAKKRAPVKTKNIQVKNRF